MAWLVLVGAAALLAVGPPVGAHTWDNMYPNPGQSPTCVVGSICRTDNSTLTVYVGDLNNPGMGAATEFTLDNSWHQTDIDVSYVASPVYTGDFETDVVYRYQVVAGSDVGAAYCDDAVSGTNKCDQFYVDYDKDQICGTTGSNGCGNGPYQRHVACHETGHTLGLMHGSDSSPATGNGNLHFQCMSGPATLEQQFAGSHNGNQVDAAY